MIERIAVAGRGRVLRDVQSMGNLLKGQTAPDADDQNFAKMIGQALHRLIQAGVGGTGLVGRLVQPEDFRRGLLPTQATLGAAKEVNRPAADGGINQRIIWSLVPGPLPGLHQGILEDIVRVRLAPRLSPGEEQKLPGAVAEPGGPR